MIGVCPSTSNASATPRAPGPLEIRLGGCSCVLVHQKELQAPPGSWFGRCATDNQGLESHRNHGPCLNFKKLVITLESSPQLHADAGPEPVLPTHHIPQSFHVDHPVASHRSTVLNILFSCSTSSSQFSLSTSL